MKNYLQKLFLFISLYCSSLPAMTAQFWDLLLDPVLIEGVYYAIIAGPNEPTWKETTFASFPYDAPKAGLFLPTTLVGDKSRLQAIAHFQNNERRTSGGFAQVKYAPISLLTADISHLQLIDKDNNTTNNVGFTSFSLSYNRLRHHRIHFWWGFGGLFMNESQDRVTDTSAFILNVGFNYYFKKPLSLYAESQMGDINDTFGAISQARIQVHLERFLIYAGYQDVNFSEIRYSGIAIGGGVFF